MNIFGDAVIQSLRSGKTRKRKNLQIYFWCSLPDLKHDKKRFIRIPSLNVQEMRPFSQFYQMVAMETLTVRHHQVAGENVINDQNFQAFCF